jgi:hypothetical protein
MTQRAEERVFGGSRVAKRVRPVLAGVPKKGPLSRSLSVDSALSKSRCRRVQLLYLIALDPRGVQDKYSSSECGIGSGSIRECGFGRRAFLSL